MTRERQDLLIITLFLINLEGHEYYNIINMIVLQLICSTYLVITGYFVQIKQIFEMGPTNLRIFTCDWDSVHTQRSCSKDKPWWGCRNLVVFLKYFYILYYIV